MSEIGLVITSLLVAAGGWLGLRKVQSTVPAGASVSTIETLAMERAQQILHHREGWRLTVYLDTLGFATVGVGHKVVPRDNLRVGDTITKERAWDFFFKDVATAFDAAKRQARQVGRYTPEFIAALTSVNFQLGTGWTNDFYETWPALLRGDWQTAERNLLASRWYKQTPKRVEDFIFEIRRAFA